MKGPADMTSWTAETWPIGAALLQFPATLTDGTPAIDAPTQEWSKVMREIRLTGFDHVDLTDSWIPYGNLSAARRAELAAVIADAGLGISAISASRRSILDHDPAQAKENIAYSYRLIDTAVDLGVQVVCLGLHQGLTPAQQEATWFWLAPGAADPDDEAIYRHAVDTFQALGKYAAERDVLLSLEMYEDTYLGTADACVQMINDIGLENVGVNPDVGNIIRLHRPVEHWRDQYAKLLPLTNYWHLKNYFRDEDPAAGSYATSPAPLPMGIINYRDVIGMALDLGFNGPMCVEHYGADGLTVGLQNRDYIRQILSIKLALRDL
jgi:sugar phosphate isomerase/epimerase